MDHILVQLGHDRELEFAYQIVISPVPTTRYCPKTQSIDVFGIANVFAPQTPPLEKDLVVTQLVKRAVPSRHTVAHLFALFDATEEKKHTLPKTFALVSKWTLKGWIPIQPPLAYTYDQSKRVIRALARSGVLFATSAPHLEGWTRINLAGQTIAVPLQWLRSDPIN